MALVSSLLKPTVCCPPLKRQDAPRLTSGGTKISSTRYILYGKVDFEIGGEIP